MAMPERKFSASAEYRYGFNGKENDKDISEGGQDYGMRIYDARLGRFLSEDPITDKYPELTPYQFASNRPVDGIDEDGLEWAPAKDAKGEITSYTWAGYNKDGVAAAGTVASAVLWNKDKGYNTWYTSDSKTKSGTATFMSAGSREFRAGQVTPTPQATNSYNIDVNYKDNWVKINSLFGTYRKEVTVGARIRNENGGQNTEAETYNNNLGVNNSIYNSPNRFFNSIRQSLGYSNGPISQALVPVYPETLLLPLPKGFGLLSKFGSKAEASLIESTGGMKQWFRLGKSYSVEGGFKTYGLRWGASPKYATKIGNYTLRQANQEFRKSRIPFKSWRTADPGHFHLWKLN